MVHVAQPRAQHVHNRKTVASSVWISLKCGCCKAEAASTCVEQVEVCAQLSNAGKSLQEVAVRQNIYLRAMCV